VRAFRELLGQEGTRKVLANFGFHPQAPDPVV